MKQKKETHAQSHCERSVAIARLSNCTSDAITTQTSFARNDKRRAFTLAEGATHVGICNNTRRAAFTLAEVLITLAIIGVVAAMTIPTLISDYQEKVTVTKVKKFYSTFSNAYQLAIAEHGEISTWGLQKIYYTVDDEGKKYISDEDLAIREKFIDYVMPYIKTIKYLPLKSSSIYEDQGWFFADGSAATWLWLGTKVGGDIYLTTDGKPLHYKKGDTYSFNKNAFKFFWDEDKVYPAGFDNENFKEYCLSGYDTTYCAGWIVKFGNMEYLRCNDLDMNTKTKCD